MTDTLTEMKEWWIDDRYSKAASPGSREWRAGARSNTHAQRPNGLELENYSRARRTEMSSLNLVINSSLFQRLYCHRSHQCHRRRPIAISGQCRRYRRPSNWFARLNAAATRLGHTIIARSRHTQPREVYLFHGEVGDAAVAAIGDSRHSRS